MVRNKIRGLTLHFVQPEQDAKLTPGRQTFTFEYGARSADVFFLSRKGNIWWPRYERAELCDIAPNSYQVKLLLNVLGRETIYAVRANPLGVMLLQCYLDFTRKLHDSFPETELKKRKLWYPGITTEELPRGLTPLDSIRVEVVAKPA
jgi:hypothetical protein